MQDGLQLNKNNIIEPRALKVHFFRPSGRRILTIVGKDEEYWTEPDLNFCSCKNYYYRSLSSGKPCYHLTSTLECLRVGGFTLLEFADQEYDDFVRAIINDSFNNCSCKVTSYKIGYTTVLNF